MEPPTKIYNLLNQKRLSGFDSVIGKTFILSNSSTFLYHISENDVLKFFVRILFLISVRSGQNIPYRFSEGLPSQAEAFMKL